MQKKTYHILSLSSSRLGYSINHAGEWLAGKIESLAERPGIGVLTLISFIVGAGVRSIVGVLSGFVELIVHPSRKTLIGLFIPVLSALVILSSLLISLLQQVLYLQGPIERLTEREKILARMVFETSLNTNTIRIVRRKYGVFTWLPASFVLGNLLYLKTDHERTLIHELVHSWQYRNLGISYAGNALLAQWILGRNRGMGDAYDWKLMEAGSDDHWLSLNAEAAAELIEDTYLSIIKGDADFLYPELVKNAHQTLQKKLLPVFHK